MTLSIDKRQCDICGRLHDHYGGIHEANMLDFRWIGFAHDTVSIERFDLCPECRDAGRGYVSKRWNEYRAALLAEELKEEQREAFIEMRNDAILDAYAEGDTLPHHRYATPRGVDDDD